MKELLLSGVILVAGLSDRNGSKELDVVITECKATFDALTNTDVEQRYLNAKPHNDLMKRSLKLAYEKNSDLVKMIKGPHRYSGFNYGLKNKIESAKKCTKELPRHFNNAKSSYDNYLKSKIRQKEVDAYNEKNRIIAEERKKGREEKLRLKAEREETERLDTEKLEEERNNFIAYSKEKIESSKFEGIIFDIGLIGFIQEIQQGKKNPKNYIHWIFELTGKDSTLRVSQVVDSTLIYKSSYRSDPNIPIMIPKIKGNMYIEGQPISKEVLFYEFLGVESYTTVIGASKQAMIFKPAKF